METYYFGEEANERIEVLEETMKVLEEASCAMAHRLLEVIIELTGKCQEKGQCLAGREVDCGAWRDGYCLVPELAARRQESA